MAVFYKHPVKYLEIIIQYSGFLLNNAEDPSTIKFQ